MAWSIGNCFIITLTVYNTYKHAAFWYSFVFERSLPLEDINLNANLIKRGNNETCRNPSWRSHNAISFVKGSHPHSNNLSSTYESLCNQSESWALVTNNSWEFLWVRRIFSPWSNELALVSLVFVASSDTWDTKNGQVPSST